MDQGDFFVHFMDLTEEELRKPVEDITPTRLEALLELALRMSTANTDPFKDDLKVGMDCRRAAEFHMLLRGRSGGWTLGVLWYVHSAVCEPQVLSGTT